MKADERRPLVWNGRVVTLKVWRGGSVASRKRAEAAKHILPPDDGRRLRKSDRKRERGPTGRAA